MIDYFGIFLGNFFTFGVLLYFAGVVIDGFAGLRDFFK